MELKEIILSDMTNRPQKNEVGFNHQIRIFELLLSRYLRGIKTDEVRYLDVYCIDDIQKTLVDSYTIENGLTVRIPYNPLSFLECKTVEEKYHEFVRILQEYISPVFQDKNWDFSPVTDALTKIKEHNYYAEFILQGTPKKSPDKQQIAIVTGIHSITSFKLVAKIYDKGGMMIKEKVLVEDVPNELVYGRYLGKPQWKDNKTFQVSSRTSKWFGTILIED